MIKSAILLLEDGTQFIGHAAGALGSVVGEIVFNTSMTGYQEILTDPSYFRQIVTLTYPHIGNVGTNKTDEESSQVYVQGLIIRNLSLIASNFRNNEDLPSYLRRHNVVAITDIDTRRLTRILREKGTQNGCIISDNAVDLQLAQKKIKSFLGLKNIDLVKEVTTLKVYTWALSEVKLKSQKNSGLSFHVVAYDYGVKRSILRTLADRGCELTIVPAHTSAEEVLNMNPDGIFFSNGPGDPSPCSYAIKAIQTFLSTNIPMFGICLGYQLLALASGAKIVKMKFGHHGVNHPVKDIDNNTVMITTQNHSFTVDEASLPKCLRVTHKSLFDGTLQGLHHIDKPAFGFQGHPEASPGPHEANMLFDHFIDLITYYCQFIK